MMQEGFGDSGAMDAERKTAVIFGGSGAIGRATAEALVREGMAVALVARSERPLQEAVDRVRNSAGEAAPFIADVLKEGDVERVMKRIEAELGPIDVAVNATGFMHDQGKTIDEVSLDEFSAGFMPFMTALFNISKGVARRMGNGRPGVFVTVVAPAAKMAMPGHLGHIVGCAGTEAYCRALASELGPRDVRVLCLRSHAVANAIDAGSHTKDLFAPKAASMGFSVEDWVKGAAGSTMLKRLPDLAQVAGTIAFLTSEAAGAMTGTVVNMTAGTVLD